MQSFEQTVEARGHLIDSGIMSQILDRIIEGGCTFEIEEFRVGRTNDDYSLARIRIHSPMSSMLDELLDSLVPLGCYLAGEEDVRLAPAPGKARVPDDFYSTTNYRTFVRLEGEWKLVQDQRMDAVIRVDSGKARAASSCGIFGRETWWSAVATGIKVVPEFKDRERKQFTFMSNEISSERRVELAVRQLAEDASRRP